MIPLWAALAITGSLLVTAVPLVQEKFKADGFALAFWVKVFTGAFIAPMAFYTGLPDAGMFYFYTLLTAFVYAVSDIYYFRAVPVVGSGIVTRILPASVVITFFAWFAVDPDLAKQYLQMPWKLSAILAIMVLFTFFAMQVKKCTVTWQGVRLVWPVLFAACTGPVLTKLALDAASTTQAVPSYIFVQALMMASLMGLTWGIKKPVPRAVFLSKNALRTGFVVGVVAVVTVFLKIKAIQLVDNPGFVSMIMFSDALWVLLIYRLTGKKEQANIWAGLGIVFCALGIVVIKSL